VLADVGLPVSRRVHNLSDGLLARLVKHAEQFQTDRLSQDLEATGHSLNLVGGNQGAIHARRGEVWAFLLSRANASEEYADGVVV
jgi:hypothetical protein